MTAEQVPLRLSRAHAIVLFEFLSRFSQQERLTIEHQAEERVLWDLCADLERELAEPFRADYADILRGARELVADPSKTGD
jgi:hypothetical protein